MSKASDPPPRLLIGYEHARCNTNTDVILPAGVFELTTAEAIDAFEPTVIQLADQHKPTCPICGTLMDFAIWGPHDNEADDENRRSLEPHVAERDLRVPAGKLEDVFAGTLELFASELACLRHALVELYTRGGWCPKGENRRDFTTRVLEKLGALKLDRMVTLDGSRLVSVEEHAAAVVANRRDVVFCHRCGCSPCSRVLCSQCGSCKVTAISGSQHAIHAYDCLSCGFVLEPGAKQA